MAMGFILPFDSVDGEQESTFEPQGHDADQTITQGKQSLNSFPGVTRGASTESTADTCDRVSRSSFALRPGASPEADSHGALKSIDPCGPALGEPDFTGGLMGGGIEAVKPHAGTLHRSLKEPERRLKEC